MIDDHAAHPRHLGGMWWCRYINRVNHTCISFNHLQILGIASQTNSCTTIVRAFSSFVVTATRPQLQSAERKLIGTRYAHQYRRDRPWGWTGTGNCQAPTPGAYTRGLSIDVGTYTKQSFSEIFTTVTDACSTIPNAEQSAVHRPQRADALTNGASRNMPETLPLSISWPRTVRWYALLRATMLDWPELMLDESTVARSSHEERHVADRIVSLVRSTCMFSFRAMKRLRKPRKSLRYRRLAYWT